MKQFKRFIAMVMAAAMIAGLGVTAGASSPQIKGGDGDGSQQSTLGEWKDPNDQSQGKVTDFDKYSITIKDGDINKKPGVTQNDHDYYAYQIFKGDVNRNDTSSKDELAITGWGSDVSDTDGKAIIAALKANTTDFQVQATNEDGAKLYTDASGNPTTQATTGGTANTPIMVNAFANIGENDPAGVAKVLSSFKDGSRTGVKTGTGAEDVDGMLDAFASIVAAQLESSNVTGTPLPWDDSIPGYKADNLDEGYYLIRDKGPAAASDDFISKNLIELLGGNVEIAPKGTIPTVDKGVQDGGTAPTTFIDQNGAQVNIGDKVFYTLKGTVSSMINSYDEYEYKFVDKLSKGLTFGGDETQTAINDVLLLDTNAKTLSDDATAKGDDVTSTKNAYVGASATEDTNDEYGWTGEDSASALGVYKANKATKEQAATDADNNLKAVKDAITYYEGVVANGRSEQEKAVAQLHLDQLNGVVPGGFQLATTSDSATVNGNPVPIAKDETDADLPTEVAGLAKGVTLASATTEADNANQAVTDAEQTLANAKKAYEEALAAKAEADRKVGARQGQIDAALAAGQVSNTGNHPTDYELLSMDYDALDATQKDLYNAAMEKVKAHAAGVATSSPIQVYLYNNAGTSKGQVNPNDYDVTYTPGQGLTDENGKTGDKVEINFPNVKTITNTSGAALNPEAGDYLVVVYPATLNKDAIIGNPGNQNEAYVEYDTDPDKEGKGTSTPDGTEVFTFEFDINKISKTSKERLPGAGFFLFKENTETVVTDATTDPPTTETRNTRYYAQVDADGNFVKWVGPLTVPTINGTTGWTSAQRQAVIDAGGTLLTTGDDGRINVKGLESGTYKLAEAVVPYGYNYPGDDFTVNLNATIGNLTASKEIECNNELNPDYNQAKVNAGTATGAEAMKYLDAYGDPTNDPIKRIKSGNYDPADTSTSKWLKTAEVKDGTGAVTTAAEYTNTDTQALPQKMTLKYYEVTGITVTVNGSTGNSDETTEFGTVITDIENSIELALPETGGIGTTIFYIVGGVLVVGAAVVMITRKRVEG